MLAKLNQTSIHSHLSRLMALSPFEFDTVEDNCPHHGMVEGYVRKNDGAVVCGECLNEQSLADEEEQRLESRLNDIGFGEKHNHCTVNNYKPEKILMNDGSESDEEFMIKRRITGWVKGFSLESNGFLMAGTNGNGKTHLMAGIGREIVRRGYSCKYLTAETLASKIEHASHWSTPISKNDVYDSFTAMDLLLLDEVAASELKKEAQGGLTEILNRRYADNRPTILASNKTPENVRKSIGDRAYSKLCISVLIFRGRNRREDLNKAW